MKPVMFCRKSSGIVRLSHNSMKCAPFKADSENSTPLLAMMPTGWPWMRAKPVTSVLPYSALNSANSPPSTIRVDDLVHVVGHPGIDGYDVIELGLVGDADRPSA